MNASIFRQFFKNGAIAFSVVMLSGCLGAGATDDTFSLASVREVEGPKSTNRQILVPEPSALKVLDSEQVVIRVGPSEIQYLAKARWGDRLPKMVQSRLVEVFENSGRLGGVGKPGEGLAIDYQIVSEIRAFEVEAFGGSRAHIQLFVKILNDRNGTVRAQRVFEASSPISGTGNTAYIAALNRAFASVTTDIVGWTLKSL